MPFPIGSRVLIRSEEWLVRGVQSTGVTDEKGNETYAVQVVGMSETVRDYRATFLTSLDDIQELKPEDVRFVFDDSPNYRRSRLFLHALMVRTPLTEPGITTRGQAVMADNEYQYVPAQMALHALRPRILIADGVGLGKTIEAGILLAELIRRGRGRRILVVSTRAMLEQLQKELWMRFSIPLIRLDSEGLARIRRNIPIDKNPFYYYDRAIISMDTLKSPDYQYYLENTRWDVVWIDECHNVANSDTQRRRMAEILSRNSEALILSSATPHNGKPESFATLLRMLDPTLVADPKQVRTEDLQGYVVRRYKADVVRYTGNFPQLHAEPVMVPANDKEERILEQLSQTLVHAVHRHRPKRDRLFAVTLLKSFLSSPMALQKTAETRLRRLLAARPNGGPNEDLELSHPDARWEEDVKALRSLAEAAAAIPIEETAKFKALCGLLEEWGWDGSPRSPRIVLFSERIDTLKELQRALLAKFSLTEDVVPVFTAQLTDIEQEEKVRSFNEENSPIRLLLATDVMSEGVNLHHQCHHLIHYDIPWSFIRLEQRNGRIDRFGQLHVPEVRYLVLRSAGEAQAETRVAEKLVEKAQVIRESLGDPTEVLHLKEPEAEAEYIAEQLAEGTDVDDLFGDWDDFVIADGEFDFVVSDPLPRSADRIPIQEVSVPGLYANWMDLARDLANEMPAQRRRHRDLYGFDDPALADEAVLIDSENQRVVLRGAEEEMRIRLRNLPREAMPGGDLKLTTDPHRMMRSMSRATDEGGWTEEHLLWDVHPAADWMLDRALGLFGAREVPTLQLADLPENETHYLIQAMVNTRSGHPVLADWLVVTRTEEGYGVRPWQGRGDPLLWRPWINAGHDPVVGRDLDLEEVLAEARRVVAERAESRRRELAEKVEEAKLGIERWYEQELQPLQTSFDFDDPLARARWARAEIRRQTLVETYRVVMGGYDRMLEFEAPVLRVCARLMRG